MKTRKLIYSKNPLRGMAALFLAVVMLLVSVPVQGQSLLGIRSVKAAGISLSNPRAELSNPKTTEGGVTTWDCVYFGNYVQSDAEGADPEPIKWRVLSVDGDDLFLLADKGLEQKKYNETRTSVTWETSTLRTWLNGAFLETAFTAEEQAAIRDTEVANDDNPKYGTSGGYDTTDKVFLLSIEEAMNTGYGFTNSDFNTDTRKASATAYAGDSGTSAWWWLRSPGDGSDSAANVSAAGSISLAGPYANEESLRVRPALHVNLKSLRAGDYAGTVDSKGNVTKSTINLWDCVYFGNYIQSNTAGADPEPIKWRVLSVDGDDVFLLADKNLENKEYNETYKSVTWETSTLRTWLNGDFLKTAFTAEEQAAILDTLVVNGDNPKYGTSGGNDTTDKVFPLSIEEVMNTDYGFTNTDSKTSTRKAESTAYAGGLTGLWWLRSPGNGSNFAACMGTSGEIDYFGGNVNGSKFVVRPAMHINLQSLSVWNYAGTVDSEGNVRNPEPSITMGAQTGTLTYGAGGSATYEIESVHFGDSVFTPEVVWDGTVPKGVTPVFNDGNTQLTLATSDETAAGVYRFHVSSGSADSDEVALTIGKADVSAITTAVDDVSMTAYEARNATSGKGVVALSGLPSEVDVALAGGGTATLPITWATASEYNAKGAEYAVTGTLIGNDNVNVGSVTKQATVTVTPIIAPKPTFTEISVIRDEAKTDATAFYLGYGVLPSNGTVSVDVGGGETKTVDCYITWSQTETLDMTVVGNEQTFNGAVRYSSSAQWLTPPADATVTRKVTVREKTPVTVTVTAPDDITYGEGLGNPSAVTGDTVGGAIFTYQYSGTLFDAAGTQYNSTKKPTDPGSYTVTAVLVSTTHMGTSEAEGFIIRKKDLTWAANGVANSKAYDGTAAATAETQPTLGGVIRGDNVSVKAGGLTFAGVNAGEGITVTASGYGITGTDAWKYNEPSGQPAFETGRITPKITTLTVESIDGRDYTGQEQTPVVVVKDGNAILTWNTDYEVAYSGNTNAGTAKVTVTGKGNYEGSTGSAEFTINKITYNGEKAASKNVVCDTAATDVTMSLPDLPDGAVYGTARVTTTNGLVTGTPGVAGTTLTFDVAPKEAGTTDTITIPVIGATNYMDYNVEATITAVTKTYVTISGVNVDDKTYDGTAATKSGVPTANDGTSDVDIRDYDYKWQNADGESLAGAPKDAGSYKLVVSVSDDNADYTGSQEIIFTIRKAAVTITADDITAAVGDPTPTYTYTVDGLASGESLKTVPALSCTPDMGKAGTYTITPSGAEVPESGNYEEAITYRNGTLTIQAAQVTNSTIHFNANGGTGGMASVTVPKGAYTLPSCTFSRSNYSFGGWKVDNAGVTYNAGETITIDGDVTLYAQWTYKDDASGDVSAKGYSGVYDKEAHGITVTCPSDATVLYSERPDGGYTAKNPTYTNVGSYTVYYKVMKENNVIVSGSEMVVITQKRIAKPTIPNTHIVYDGKEQSLSIAQNETYTISGSKATEAGTHTVIISLKDKENYAWADGSTEVIRQTWSIQAKSLSADMLTLSPAMLAYTGNAVIPTVTVIDGTVILKAGTDYDVSYLNNKNIGTATVRITGKGNYEGSTSKTYQITVSKGKTYTVGGIQYKITNADTNGKGTVQVTGASKKSVKSLTIGKTVKIGGKDFQISSIGNKAFKGCNDLKKVAIGENVTSIGKEAFRNCKRLKTITIKTTKLKANKVGANAFTGINKKVRIKVPKGKVKSYQAMLRKKGISKTAKVG